MATYKNSFHKPRNGDSGPEFFTVDAKAAEYKGFKIYQRIPGSTWDIVKGGVCISMYAGPNGARRFIDQLTSA